MPQNSSEKSYRDLLKNEFDSRQQKNSRYSLRSFSKLLSLSPSYVSLLFRGKKNLSLSTANDIADVLKWTPQQKKYFMSLVDFENPQTEDRRKLALEQVVKARSEQVPYDSFNADFLEKIEGWQHNAILVLLTLDNKNPTTQFIKKKLNLSLEETKNSLNRLQRLGLVTQTNSAWATTTTHLDFPSTPSKAIRNYHSQMLSLAEAALQKQNFTERDFSNITFTVDAAKLEAAKAKIYEFRKELAQFLEGDTPTEVYQLSVQLFKLTQSEDLT